MYSYVVMLGAVMRTGSSKMDAILFHKTAFSRVLFSALTDDLRRKPWKGSPNPLAGHCYLACEVLSHISDGKLKPYFVRHEGAPHWFLKDENGNVLDPTVGQFNTTPDYTKGRGKGFLTKKPSKRAKIVLDRLHQ